MCNCESEPLSESRYYECRTKNDESPIKKIALGVWGLIKGVISVPFKAMKKTECHEIEDEHQE